jgi:putative OPT family oligopeptide transporter
MKKTFEPYVPAQKVTAEFTLKAVILGLILACLLGAANAYLGLKVGMTVAATFPATIIAMTTLRILKGSVLEENMARTIASTGEALVAGAIFTIPAFVISGSWDSLASFESYLWGTAMMFVGGALGVCFVIALRRTMVEDKGLPFPESVACAEIVKAGQTGGSSARYVFSTLIAGFSLEFFKNDYMFKFFEASRAISIVMEPVERFIGGVKHVFNGGFHFYTPEASPCVMGVGFIIGPKLASITFSGAVFGHLLLLPILVFMFGGEITTETIGDVSTSIYTEMVKPLAIGAMLTGSIFTIWSMRATIVKGIRLAFPKKSKIALTPISRLDTDLNLKKVYGAIGLMTVLMAILYYLLTGKGFGSIIAAIVMALAGFLFAAVAAYLVGLIGSSSNPISGLTLSTLIVAAALMLLIGVKGIVGVEAVLGVACVVCCACGIAGDMMQDLKVGHLLGGTPRKMEIGEIIGVVFVAFVMMIPIMLLDNAYGIGRVVKEEVQFLAAPQANLMAMTSQAIILGNMPWICFISGIAMAFGLILLRSPSVTLIAVGMYLPFTTVFAIFVGGLIKWILERLIERKNLSNEVQEDRINIGILLASGFVAGEALGGIVIAAFVASGLFQAGWFASLTGISGKTSWPAIFVILGFTLIMTLIPLRTKTR